MPHWIKKREGEAGKGLPGETLDMQLFGGCLVRVPGAAKGRRPCQCGKMPWFPRRAGKNAAFLTPSPRNDFTRIDFTRNDFTSKWLRLETARGAMVFGLPLALFLCTFAGSGCGRLETWDGEAGGGRRPERRARERQSGSTLAGAGRMGDNRLLR